MGRGISQVRPRAAFGRAPAPSVPIPATKENPPDRPGNHWDRNKHTDELDLSDTSFAYNALAAIKPLACCLVSIARNTAKESPCASKHLSQADFGQGIRLEFLHKNFGCSDFNSALISANTRSTT
ncbi:hypothetical protein NDU88_001421 [Pleurodeles waltl]|uniref:Uncharacterized protein n=1 Tax=Pleurodeles waltl TaxID=8319 RepID=A0AAV7U754_PLEWA|nr:hypothetical protein NDU88_001421 [Pleurodeles waltl]